MARGKHGTRHGLMTCRCDLRQYAKRLGHDPARGRGVSWEGGYRTFCLNCGANIQMVPSKLGPGFRMVGILQRCGAADANNYRYGWGI